MNPTLTIGTEGKLTIALAIEAAIFDTV